MVPELWLFVSHDDFVFFAAKDRCWDIIAAAVVDM
jgi:hypothetical protein